MLFRRQNDPMPANSQTGSAPQTRPLTATTQPAQQYNRSRDTDIRAVNANSATLPTPPIAVTTPLAQAQQRRVIATPTGSFSMPANNSGSREGQRKLQVGRDITLNGEIGACDHLAIEGTVTAMIKQLQQFDILDYGTFSGTVVTENADINGNFDGDLTVTGRLWLRQNAVVSGTIRYAALQVEKGACLRGTIDMLEPKAQMAAGGATFSQNDVTTNNAADTTTYAQS